MGFVPFILGSGRAAQAIEKSLACLAISEPDFDVRPVVRIPRGASLEGTLAEARQARSVSDAAAGAAKDVLVIAGPPGLHARALIEAQAAGFHAALCEKPACVREEEIEALSGIRMPVAVAHVYRQTWGVRALRDMLREGRLGELVALEGRYWQSSSAERSRLGPTPESARSWKNDPALSGPSDTLLDVGTHWFDAACYLLGGAPESAAIWRSHLGAEAPHRDTHVQATLTFTGGRRAFASISKMLHGASNHFELVLVGTRASASWSFLDPDRVHVGEGRESRVIIRRTTDRGSGQMAFHGLGWLEGYVDILANLFGSLEGRGGTEFPTLADSLALMRVLAPELRAPSL